MLLLFRADSTGASSHGSASFFSIVIGNGTWEVARAVAVQAVGDVGARIQLDFLHHLLLHLVFCIFVGISVSLVLVADVRLLTNHVLLH